MIDTATLAAWRDEIEAELADARLALGVATEALEAAEAARDAAMAQQRETAATIAALREPMAFALRMRVQAAGEGANAAAGAVARARGQLEAARGAVADRVQALRQIAKLLTPADVGEEEAVNA